MPSIQELEAKKEALVETLSLDCLAETGGLPSKLAHANLATLVELLDRTRALSGNNLELSEFITDFIKFVHYFHC